MTTLVIVESPGKIKKIQSILGDKYHVTASCGHLIDIDDKNYKLSIDIQNGFKPSYEPKEDKKAIIRDLKRLYKKYGDIIIATDDDREGEMIAWSIKYILNLENPKRIAFKAITQNDIMNAINNPRFIDENLVNAQKARRVTDMIIGFEATPTLYKYFKTKNLSAGRVQSVAERLLVERETEIQIFKENNNKSFFKAKCKFDPDIIGDIYNKLDENKIISQDDAKKIIQKCIESEFIISKIKVSETTKSPSPPYITSTLQQDAHKRFGFSAKTTMTLAQRLYEEGFITYMRTDSVTLSNDAMNELKTHIIKEYGDKYYRRMEFKTKSKNAQEAHECIRPTHINDLSTKMGNEYDKLYKMIWKRTVACQMSPAKYEVTDATIDITKLSDYYCLATIRKLIFKGFLILGTDSDDDIVSNNKIMPEKGSKLNLIEISADEQYNNHPPRFDEATIIRELEVLGIGRPSTYASTIATILKREYANICDTPGEKKNCTKFIWKKGDGLINTLVEDKLIWGDKKKLKPTILGTSITEYLKHSFSIMMDYKFTAELENKLDEIAGDRYTYPQFMKEFYDSFHPCVIKASTTVCNINNDRLLGEHGGHKYYASKNKYGPVIKRIAQDGGCSYSGIDSKEPGMTQETITLDNAINLFKYPKNIGQLNDKDIMVCHGPYGYYIKYDNENISISSGEISYEEVLQIIETRKKVKFEDGTNTYLISEGKYGKYISVTSKKSGKPKNIPIPKDRVVDTIDDINKIISNYLEYKKNNPGFKKGGKKRFDNKKN